MAVLASRFQELIKLQAKIFGHSYNPSLTRTGGKILRQRLKGPAVASYYPPRTVTFKDVERIAPFWETYDEKEAERDDNLAITKARGKGRPKKKRTLEESKKFRKRKGPGAAKAAAAVAAPAAGVAP